MFRTLFSRLAAALVAVSLVLSFALVAVLHGSHRAFHLELDQKAHQDLAGRLLAAARPVRIEAVLERVRELALLNPAIAAYSVLDDGMVTASSLATAQLRRGRVDTGPILQFIAGPKTWPLLGDDPATDNGKAIFSAAPLPSGNGYLYVVLSGANGGSGEAAERPYVLREAVWLTLGNVAAALAAALLVVGAITRPVTRLRQAMNAFESSNLEGNVRYRIGRARAGPDEIGRLGEIFDSMADRIAVQVDSLRRADKARRELYANVSHDLQTPLTSLHGYVQTLLMKDSSLPTGQRRRYLEILERQTQQLRELVEQITDLARLETPEIRLQKEPIELQALLLQIIEDLKPIMDRNGLTLKWDTAESPVIVNADISLLRRALTNIVVNAVQASPQASQVGVRVTSDGTTAVVGVIDKGPGLGPESERIFDAGYRGTHPRMAGSPGMGLGLAIAKRVVLLHRGTIFATNLSDGGALLQVALPLADRK